MSGWIMETLEKLPLVERLSVPEVKLDGAQLTEALWELSNLDRRFDHKDVHNIAVCCASLLESGLPEDEAQVARLNNILQEVRQLVEAGEDALFERYMRDLLADKRIAQTYRSVHEAFPPGSVGKDRLTAMMYSLGSHVSLELERTAAAERALRDINETITSILDNEAELIEVLRFAGRYLNSTREADHGASSD